MSNEADDNGAEIERQMLDAINKWLDRDVRPHVLELEHADTYPQEMVKQMTEMGLFGSIIPEQYGGLGLSASTYAKIVATISEVWMSLTGIFNSHLIMAAAVQRFGTQWQKQHFLPKFASGEIRGGLALTEPDCGTDLQAVRMRAVRDGDDYILNGTKTWISNGIHGSCFAVLVKTDTEIQPRHKGTALFLCEKGEGFRVSRKLEKLGYKGIDSAELIFDDYRVPAAHLIGGVEGSGFHHAVASLRAALAMPTPRAPTLIRPSSRPPTVCGSTSSTAVSSPQKRRRRFSTRVPRG